MPRVNSTTNTIKNDDIQNMVSSGIFYQGDVV